MQHTACAISEIDDGGKKVVNLGGTKVLLLRRGEQVYAVRNRCAHMSLPLSPGKFEGNEIVCRFHGARFDVETGKVCKRAWLFGGLGKESIDTFPVELSDGQVLVTV